MDKLQCEAVVTNEYDQKVFGVEFTKTRGEAQQYGVDVAKEFDTRHIVKVWNLNRDGDLIIKVQGAAKVELNNLNAAQRKLYDRVEQIGGGKGADCRDILIQQDALAKDKAAVADVFGGPGAGDEFRREHISKRGKCRLCPLTGIYYDGMRDPYWAHEGITPGRAHGFMPNDAHTRLVFEKTGSHMRRAG